MNDGRRSGGGVDGVGGVVVCDDSVIRRMYDLPSTPTVCYADAHSELVWSCAMSSASALSVGSPQPHRTLLRTSPRTRQDDAANKDAIDATMRQVVDRLENDTANDTDPVLAGARMRANSLLFEMDD
jgi:hypothetical protein